MGVYIKGVTELQLMKVIINSTEFMPDNFEVIEVKTPHGRLIDESKIESVFIDELFTGYHTRTKVITGADAPTVIEAEVE